MAGERAMPAAAGLVQRLIRNGVCQPGAVGSDLSICPKQALEVELLGMSPWFMTPPKVQ